MSKRNRKNSLVPPDRKSLAGGITEGDLRRIEADPQFQKMMKQSEEDLRAARYINHEVLIRRLEVRRKRRAG